MQALNKKRWRRNTENMSAVVTSEFKRALFRVNSRPDRYLEAFTQNDPTGVRADEDCWNFIRASAPL
eukprot:14646441-Alexandrium_andersonii.AAC.1